MKNFVITIAIVLGISLSSIAQGDWAVKLPGYGITPAQADMYQQSRAVNVYRVPREPRVPREHKIKKDNSCSELAGVMAITWGMSQSKVEAALSGRGGILENKNNYQLKYSNIIQGDIKTDSVIAYFKNNNVYEVEIYYPSVIEKAEIPYKSYIIFNDIKSSLTQKYYPPQYSEKYFSNDGLKNLTFVQEIDAINNGLIDVYNAWAFDKNCQVKSTTFNLPTIQCTYSNIYLEVKRGRVKCTYSDSKYSVEMQRNIYNIMKDAIEKAKKDPVKDF